MTDSRRPEPNPLAQAHRRFARAAVAIYASTAAVAVSLLILAFATDLTHQEQDARDTLMLETQVRAQALSRHLGLLSQELRRLGLRSEVDLLDHNMEPERSLLRLSHDKSAFFNVGLAIVDLDGTVAWSEPSGFLKQGSSVALEPWFDAVRRWRSVRIVGVEPERASDSILYMVSPINRGGQFTGALIGAVDLARGDDVDPTAGPGLRAITVIATRDGSVIFPPRPPPFAAEQRWKEFAGQLGAEPLLTDLTLSDHERVVASAPVGASGLYLLSIISTKDLFGPANARLAGRLALGLGLCLAPLGLLVLLLRRSYRVLLRSEEEAMRQEQLRMLGEAVNLIAHEIKNSLNGIRLGLDLVLSGARQGQTVATLRDEVARLSDFTGDLLTFSKGVTPRAVPFDLGDFVHKVCEVLRPDADEARVALEVRVPQAPVRVRADPGLVHSIVKNLVGNAIDALTASGDDDRRVTVNVEAAAGKARIRVCDNGSGVSAAVADRLFEPFVTGKPSGVGLGLAMSRKIAQAHGGDLTYCGTDKGAEFVVDLPLEQDG